MKRAAWLAGIAASGAAAFVIDHFGLGGTSALTTGVLTATLVAIVWYSWETRRLADVQQRSAALEEHPWISATSLKVEAIEPGHDAPLGGQHMWLPVTNTGRTHAFAVEVEARGEARDPATDAVEELSGRWTGQVLVPNDSCHVRVGSVKWFGPTASVVLRVDVRYSTIGGGSGHPSVGFMYDHGGWKNVMTSYQARLPDSTRVP